MKKLVCGIALAWMALSPAQAQLVIAGGGLEAETEDVWRAFIDRAQGDGDFVIVPSASGSPVQSAASVRDTLIRYNVAEERISVAPLAIVDDPSTEDVDESEWANNADDSAVQKQLETASAIWFTGGDQIRTMDILDPGGRASLALNAIRKAHASGVPIGGTSAGAAIMSGVMIMRGDSLRALTGSDRDEPLRIGSGLGFLPQGVVDQHFGERARLGRLAVALLQQEDAAYRMGFGVDEDTAMIHDGSAPLNIVGTGYVTLLDARNAKARRINEQLHISGLVLHLASAGDQIDLETLKITPAAWKEPTVGAEYVEQARPGGGGMAVPGQMLSDVIGEGLIDNAESRSIERISFDDDGRGVGYIFTQSDRSEGYWGRGPDGVGRYSIANIQFDIVPVALTLETLK